MGLGTISCIIHVDYNLIWNDILIKIFFLSLSHTSSISLQTHIRSTPKVLKYNDFIKLDTFIQLKLINKTLTLTKTCSNFILTKTVIHLRLILHFYREVTLIQSL